MTKITLDQLNAMLADPARDEADLAAYFIHDEDASGPFSPKFALNPDTVEIPSGPMGDERSAAIMNAANWYARLRRRRKFYDKLADGHDGPIIVSEGDSWFQYPLRLHDTIDKLMEKYAIFSLGAAGDLLERMANKQEYMAALRETNASILLMSGGGNDLVAGGALADFLEEYDPDLLPGDYLKPEFQTLLDNAFAQYERMFRQVHGSFPHVRILCHGYDYPIPNAGKWLGRPMEVRNINSRILQKQIGEEMMNRFNRGLRRLVRTMPHVTYIDCRNVVGGRWFDELHPTDDGYAAVAALFDREIAAIANTRTRGGAFAGLVIEGPFGGGTKRVAAQPAPLIAERAVQARSLHLGLNEVDPDHYGGWYGKLNACENDAVALLDLAKKQGFETDILLTRAATRQVVVDKITDAAASLKEGDMFMWTISSHGGQLYDLNADETQDDPANRKDETLLLYDFQMADDEIYDLWSRFKRGVRILFMPDTCHSGDMLRAGLPVMSMPGFAAPEPQIKTRLMPPDIARKTFMRNEAAYRDYSDSLSAIREDRVLNPLGGIVNASVISFAACHQLQLANDGPRYGAFTGAVLKAWGGGQFSGDYDSFHAAVSKAIDNPTQTPQLKVLGAPDPAFRKQVPFTVWGQLGGTGGLPGASPPLAGGGGTATTGKHAATPADALRAEEGAEQDVLPQSLIDDLVARHGKPPAGVTRGWADQDAFGAFIDALGLRHFDASEFLILGGGHQTPGGKCFGKNGFPPRSLWPNIANTARVLDELRHRLNRSVIITNAYRNESYNACIGGASASQHKRFNALDFQVPGMATQDYATILRKMRDDEQFFRGGIGLYNSFVHVDTRGTNPTWPARFRDGGTRSGATAMSRSQRRKKIEAVDLPATRSRMPRVISAFKAPLMQAGAPDPDAAERQKLQAAVNASSLVSFVDNLTPGQKEDVLLSTLFAQRAADAKADPVADRQAWLRHYMTTLNLLGWSTESAPEMQQNILQGHASFDQAVLKILATIATQNQFAILKSAMEGLRSLGDTAGQIKLFDLSTSVTKGGHFQIGAAEASGDVVSMALGAFHYEWSDKQKNVLFARWGETAFDYWMAAQRMSLSPALYDDVRDLVSEKLNDSRKKLIADIPLG